MEINISELCNELQEIVSFIEKRKVKVEYFNGLKPSGYMVPQFTTTKMALSGVADEIKMSWYAEIFVDGMCIYREQQYSMTQDWDLCEERANKSLISSIFRHGVMLQKKFLEDFKNPK